MALVGSLHDLSLPELLAIVANGEKSGVITIRSDAATAQIHVDEGRSEAFNGVDRFGLASRRTSSTHST